MTCLSLLDTEREGIASFCNWSLGFGLWTPGIKQARLTRIFITLPGSYDDVVLGFFVCAVLSDSMRCGPG